MSDSQTEVLNEFFEAALGEMLEIESVLVNWESEGFSANTVDLVFRFFHNIKGTSGMFGLNLINEVFHVTEDLLSILREEKSAVTHVTTNLFIEVLDWFKICTTHISKTHFEPKDKPYDLLARLTAAKAQAKSDRQPKETGAKDDLPITEEKKSTDDSFRITSSQASEIIEIVSDFIQLQNRLFASLLNTSESYAMKNDIKRFSARLQNFVLAIRLAPIHPVLNGLNRAAKMTANQTHKRVRLHIAGGETQLDRRLIEVLRNPLIHMIRNAVDHGLETPEVRIQSKKNEEGTITIEAIQQAGQVVISMADDGKGIDPAVIKNKAIEKGLTSAEEAAQMSEKEILNFIFAPGFSTAANVTEISGRGVGMDSIKSAVEEVGGSVDIFSEIGQGTIVRLTLPLTLAIVKSLGFVVGTQMYAVPQVNVEEVITEGMARNKQILGEVKNHKKVLHLRNALIPVINLRELFSLSEKKTADSIFVVVRCRRVRIALEVDCIAGTRDFVSQPIPEVFSKLQVINGVNQLNSGQYVSLLDLNALESIVEPKKDLNAEASNTTKELDSDIFRSQQKLVFFRSGRNLAIPVHVVKQVIKISFEQIESVGERFFFSHNNKTYPVLRLWKHFSKENEIAHRDEYTAIIVEREKRLAALICEDFYGIDRLPRDFEKLINDQGVLGSVNHLNKNYILPNIHDVFAMEFPNEFTTFHRNDFLFHVLIVEDDSFFATSLSEFIKSKGMVAHIAQNGIEAQVILKTSTQANSNAPKIDYIITDLEMPKMNGMELLRWIRKTPETKSIPVIMCTAVGDDSIRKEAQKLGIEYFSTKMGYEKIIDYIEIRRKQAQIGVSDESVVSFDRHVEEVNKESTASILTFEVNGNLFGIEVEHLKEISGGSTATEIPGMTKYISNMLGFRGNPIPILDLRQIDGAAIDVTRPPHQIVALVGDSLCALWVDKVIDVRRLRRLNKSEAVDIRNFGKYMYLLISNVLWDQNEPIAQISYEQLGKLLNHAKERVKPLNQKDLKESLLAVGTLKIA